MILTVDIIEKWLDERLDLTAMVISVSYDSINDISTIEFDDSLHLNIGMTFSFSGDDFKVVSSNASSNTVTVEGDVSFLENEKVEIQKLFYKHGTPLAINGEIKLKDVFVKYPMAYLYERMPETFHNALSSLDRTSTIKLFLLEYVNKEEWKTDDHYERVLLGLEKLGRRIIESLKKEKSYFYTEEIEFSMPKHVNWGDYKDLKGNVSSIFDDSVSGVEMNFPLPIRKCVLKI